jgi:CHAT domain-containing protein
MVLLLVSGFWFAGSIERRDSQSTYDRRLGLTDVVAAAASLPDREIAPRLTGGFIYRPFRGPAPAGAGTVDVRPDKRGLYSTLRDWKSGDSGRSPASLHGRGIVRMALNQARAACSSLEAAAEAETGELSPGAAVARLRNAYLLSDLSAAYYLRGVAEERTELLLQAVEAASRAVALEPALAPAAFNRALSIEAVHGPEQAVEAWNAYLLVDSEGGWADEAREHLRALQLQATGVRKTGAERGPSAERLSTRIEAELFPNWADAFRKGDKEKAERLLRELDSVATILRHCCENTFHERSLAAVRAALRSGRRDALRLATAHQQYRQARDLYIKNQTAAALVLFESSRDGFLSADDVFAAKPWKYVAASALYLGDSGRALHEMQEARSFCEAQSCPRPIVAHLKWVQGLAAGRGGDPQAALALYNDALQGFEEGREADNAASVRALIAENLEFLGQGENAWPHRRAAMERALKDSTLDRIYLAFNGAADAAWHRGYLTSARLFQDVVVAAAERESNTVLLADALLWRARIQCDRDPAASRQDLDRAGSLATRVEDEGRRSRLLANVAAIRAGLEPPASAVTSLTAALAYFEQSDDHYRLAELYSARAAEEEKISRPDLAEKDYRNSISVLETLRGGLSDSLDRERFFASGSTVFDRIVHYLWTTGRRNEAFLLAEQSRGREMNGGASLPLVTVRDLSDRLHDGEALVEYALLEDRLAVWVVRSNGTTTVETPVSTASLERAVRSMQDAMASRETFEARLAILTSRLYYPIASRLKGVKRLIVVANKSLRAVPFAALRDSATGRYLIEDRELILAPSASAWAAAARHDRELRRSEAPSMLVASALSGDPERNLPGLRYGRGEIEGLRALYSRTEELAGPQATPENVLEAARRAAVVHFVAHFVQNEDYPEYSSIVLEPGEGGRDLYAHAVAKASLRSTRLVFLSACGMDGRSSHNDAPLTLPESFLAAGVPLVVGSLHPVDDRATAGFALNLHRAFVETRDAVAALRIAQLQCLSSADCNDPRFWSSWIVIGGAD